jgi:hypothetical protein
MCSRNRAINSTLENRLKKLRSEVESQNDNSLLNVNETEFIDYDDHPVLSKEEIDQSNRFRTYLNYLSSLSDFLGDVKTNPQSLVADVIQSDTFHHIQGGRCKD